MRMSNAAYESGPWRIREIIPDFTLEDAWALPVHGGAEDAGSALGLVGRLDPAASQSSSTRMLWRLRWRLGGWFGWDEDAGELPIPGTGETSLVDRLPADLRGTARGMDFGTLPFRPLYRTRNELAAELSNHTVHGVMHLAWADQGHGRYRGQMGVWVKPRGAFGTAYLALIRPFRHRIVYPALMRQIERAWTAQAPAGRRMGHQPSRRAR
jgi:hypothetical protein